MLVERPALSTGRERITMELSGYGHHCLVSEASAEREQSQDLSDFKPLSKVLEQVRVGPQLIMRESIQAVRQKNPPTGKIDKGSRAKVSHQS